MSARRVERASWYESFSSDVGLCLSTHNMVPALRLLVVFARFDQVFLMVSFFDITVRKSP